MILEGTMRWTLFAVALFACGGTHKVKVEPVEIKPIHMTVDVNVKVDRELDEFFEFEKREVAPEKRPAKPEPQRRSERPDDKEDPS